VLDEKPTVVSVGSAGERSGTRGQVRYGLLRSFGVSRLDAPGSAAGRGQAQMGKDFDNHRRIIEGGDNLQSAGKLSRKRFQAEDVRPDGSTETQD